MICKMPYKVWKKKLTLLMENITQVKHYEVNVAAYMLLGEWFDYLRENGEVTPEDLTNEEPFADYDIGRLFEGRIGQLHEIIARLNAITGQQAA